MHPRIRSLAIVALAASLWGVSGTVAQALFDQYGFPPLGLVTLRMLFSGVLLLVILRPRFPRQHVGRLIVFSVLGLLAVQATYFLAIANSNSPTATLLQSLSLPMMAAFEGIRSMEGRNSRLGISVSLAVAGTLLLTLGQVRVSLALTPLGLLFGLLSAASAAYYTLDSRTLTQNEDAWSVTGWGMLIGGIVSLPLGTPSLIAYFGHGPIADPWTVMGWVLFVLIAGTLLPFGLYLQGRRGISGTEAGVGGVMEPVSASIVAFVFLGIVLTPLQYLGGVLVLLAVILLSQASVARNAAKNGASPPRST